MFELNKHQVLIKSFNSRKENHGDKLKLAGTLTCEANCHNSVLDNFDPALRALLYRSTGVEERQADLSLPVPEGNLVELRLPRIKPQMWEEDFPGYKAEFESGVKIKDLIRLQDLKLSKLVFEALDGGSVCISFTLTIPAPLEWMVAGKLDFLIQESVEMTLIAPSVNDPGTQSALV